MPSGVLGQVSLAATTYTSLYTVPVSTLTYANVNLSNRNATSVVVRVGLTTGTTPTTAQFIEYDVVIEPNGVLERSGLVLEQDRQVVVYSDTANVTANVYGVEQAT